MSEPSSEGLLRPRVRCTSVIVGVVVHSRGAVVTREVEVPAGLPQGSVDLVIGGITPLSDSGSVRVELPEEGRRLVSIDSRISIPTLDEGPGPSVEALEAMQRQLDRLRLRQSSMEARAQRLRQFVAIPTSKKALREEGAPARVRAAMSLNEVASEALAALEQRLVALRAEGSRLQRERSRLELEDHQRSSAERMGASHPTRELVVHLAEGDGDLTRFSVSYAVPHAARWWPIYTLRLSEKGKQATLTMEALVAQLTGEDWTDARIGLATSQIAFNASLPRLPSLRLGKKQAVTRSGFREPPTGTEALFAGYDSFGGSDLGTDTRETRAVSRESVRGRATTPPGAFPEQSAASREAWDAIAQMADEADDEVDFSAADMMSLPPAPARARFAAPSASFAAPKKGSAQFGAAMGAPAPAAAAPPPPPPPGVDPGEDWLAFDSLELAGPDEPMRGRLQPRRGPGQEQRSELREAQESARRLGLVDPDISRGMFDYRYDAEGTARVPADGRLHRFELRSAQANSRLLYRTVPVTDPQVYRETEFDNPFDSPLLAGPIDVFSEGQLVTTTRVERVDSGGAMRVGLGVDERIRIVRNVRMQEESAGLLGGKRELTHDVEMELRSGLADEVRVEVLDRVPVSEEETVSVELVRCEPRAEKYEQLEREVPLKGGKRWVVSLPGGATRKIEYRYEVTLRAKDEIVGGNRRG